MLRQLSVVLALALAACGPVTPAPIEEVFEPLPLRLVDGGNAGPLVQILNRDLTSRDPAQRLVLNAEGGLTITLTLLDEDAALIAGGFRLSGEDGTYAVAATDALGLQYGAYELIERAGIVFLHPEETYFPPSLCLECVGAVDETNNPNYSMRGMHVHTLHPIEFESTLLGHDPATIPRWEKYLGWMIARRQNFVEWNLLRTIEHDKWIVHARELVRIAHARGFDMGIVAPIAFRQQNSFFLYDGTSAEPATDQIAASLDWLKQVPWDRINVEMGASEFISVSDVGQLEWLNFVADYLAANHPGTRMATKVHCTVNQTAPSFDDMNFNYIVQFADAGVGVMPHTVQFYDLYRAGPTYDREDFSDMLEFLLGEIGKREVFYYPETAYWVTFDNDIPLFLPQYVYARWNDLYQLRDSGMDGQINFSTGLEWGYWMNDFAAAWYAYEPDVDYLVPVRRMFSIFGAAAEEAVKAFDEHTRWQGEHLLEANGIRWLIGWDAADDIGHFVNIHGQPIVTRLYEVARMSPEKADEFANGEFTQLAQLIEGMQKHASAWRKLSDRIPGSARRIYTELDLGLQINLLRARYMQQLYAGVVANVHEDTVAAARHFGLAEDIKAQALKVVARQDATYRYPYDEIAVDRPSLTSYPFGYLRTVPDLWYWGRDMEMATDPSGYDFLHSLYNLVESGGLD